MNLSYFKIILIPSKISTEILMKIILSIKSSHSLSNSLKPSPLLSGTIGLSALLFSLVSLFFYPSLWKN